MNQFQQPYLPIPEQLIVSEEGSFAYFTFTQRLPVIIERVVAENKFAPSVVERLKTLAQDILHGLIRPLEDDNGPDIAAWATYVEPFIGKRWIDTPFYFAETYFYRRILEATQYFISEAEHRIDPFELQKRLSLETVMGSVRSATIQLKSMNSVYSHRDYRWKQALTNLLYLDLWGNRADLSLRPQAAGELDRERLETHREQRHVLLDDTTFVVNKISNFHKSRIDFLVDNAGFELITDLFLVNFLLASNAAEIIYLHLKSHPTFVSDAMVKDVTYALKVLANDSEKDVKNIAMSLQSYIADGRLCLIDHLFWTAPLFFWEMPDLLRQNLAQSDLVFIKGDANYRRLIRDCHWPFTSIFQDIVCYFPAPLTVLRTLKSELIVGLQQNQVEEVSREDSQWLINGRWGVIQLVA